MGCEDWRRGHYNIIYAFLIYLNSVSKAYILKGGTSLMMCYGLNRFSEDIDLDGFSYDIENIVNNFCQINNVKYRKGNDTNTVKRYLIHYGGVKPLKVEISYRIKDIDIESVAMVINNILVYRIQNIMQMKLSAYNGRDRIRDLYDVTFIGLNYWESLGEDLKFQMRDALSFKGIEQLDFLTHDQRDELVDIEKLGVDFLTLWDKLGLN